MLFKFTPVFDSEMEKDYKREELRRGLKDIRVLFIVFSFLFAVFSITDQLLVPPEHAGDFFAIRFYVVIPMFIVTYLLSCQPFFILIGQKILLLNFLIAGFGISFMLIMEPKNTIYYGGMFMICFSGYLLLKLDFVHATIGGWLNLLFYIIGFMAINREISGDLLFPTLFFIGANLIGMTGNYTIEKTGRKNFFSNHQIEAYNKKLEKEVSVKKEEINKINVEIVFALAKLAEARDAYTGRHLDNVGEYCRIIAEAIPANEFIQDYLSRERFQSIIKVSSSLHDVGKVGISDLILLKNGKLTEQEFEQMKAHTLIGWEILEKVQKVYPKNEFINMGVEITRHHHERYDGLGYPDGLCGKGIPITARIMALCDTYDALTSERPYKEAYSHEIAADIIRKEQSKQFDPVIVQAFIEKEEQFKQLLECH